MPVSYEPPKKIAIIGLEVDIDLIAQYNPKEIQIEKSLTWKAADNKKADLPDLEFTSAGGRTLALELLFDGYEDDVDVSETYVAKLMQLCSIMNPDGKEKEKRPSMVEIQWPKQSQPKFRGVIQSVSTKYTMFSSDGRPLRATCSIKIAEALPGFEGRPPRVGTRRRDGW
ncbi:MAG: hypothetical protein F9K40_02325 [Kofleriaceae bacterium]|nr:MAG: hypothetical protein F9K40_02325 [Kofleriaceae bacterium]MBZ0235386.1 hypothetical protein [Kofleriaceae bacterium]